MDSLIQYIFLVFVWAGVQLFFRLNRIWVFYFIWGAIGFTLISVFTLSGTFIEDWLSRTAIIIITYVNSYFHIPVMPFADVGTVLMTGTRISGYTSLEMGTECSGLLECSVFWGLIMFYPILSNSKKIRYLVIGSLIIYFINLLRVELIIVAIFWGGRQAIFFAHTILGRAVFFFMMLTMYWFFFTRTTLDYLNTRVTSGGE